MNITKKFVRRQVVAGLALSVGAVTALTACGSSDPSDSSESKQIVVGVSTPDVTSTYWISMLYGLEEQAKERGIKLVHVDAGGDTNANQQISQLQTLVRQDVDAIVVGATDGDAIRGVVDQASAKGIPVVGLGSLPNSKTLVSRIGADHHGMGVLQAKCLGEALEGKGEVGMLNGPPGQFWATDRAKGFQEELAATYPDIKVVSQDTQGYTRTHAVKVVADWLERTPNLAGMYSATDDLGAGALDAIRTAGRANKVLISTSNFTPIAQDLLKKKDFVCVSAQAIVSQGSDAIDQAINAAKGDPVDKEINVAAVLLTPSNFESADKSTLSAPSSFKP